MFRKAITVPLAASLLAISATIALAANPHIVGATSTTVAGDTVTITGKIAGLGDVDQGDVTGTATLSFDVNCANPQGRAAPGQQGVILDAGGAGSLGDTADSNGTYTFTVVFDVPLEPSKDFGCPNNKWDAQPANLTATLTSLFVDGAEIDL